jgi:hypothetical protein
LSLLLAGLLAPGLARADATPVQLVLVYMPNISNTGTSKASGIAELVMPEGEVRVSATDLPRLEGESLYAVWAVNSSTNEFEKVGSFNSAQGTGAVHYENVLPDAIPNNDWNLLLITVEDDASSDHPGSRHSIAGIFPSADNQPLPGLLPNTGGLPDVANIQSGWADRLPVSGLMALMLAVGIVAGYGVRKVTAP